MLVFNIFKMCLTFDLGPVSGLSLAITSELIFSCAKDKLVLWHCSETGLKTGEEESIVLFHLIISQEHIIATIAVQRSQLTFHSFSSAIMVEMLLFSDYKIILLSLSAN